jgi:arsenite/tail-anchored protein-transporting ATPase
VEEVDPKPQQLELEGIMEEEGGFLQELMGAIPGIDEAMSFAEVMKLIQSLDYEVVVFDTAPTGHTLRLLQFPDTLEKGLEKLQSSSLGPMLNTFGTMLGGEGAANRLGRISELQVLQTPLLQLAQFFYFFIFLFCQGYLCASMLIPPIPSVLACMEPKQHPTLEHCLKNKIK